MYVPGPRSGLGDLGSRGRFFTHVISRLPMAARYSSTESPERQTLAAEQVTTVLGLTYMGPYRNALTLCRHHSTLDLWMGLPYIFDPQWPCHDHRCRLDDSGFAIRGREVKTSTLLERGGHPFFLVAHNLFDNLQPVFKFQLVPYMSKLNARNLFHYNVLGPHFVTLGIRTPCVYRWDRSLEDLAGL